MRMLEKTFAVALTIPDNEAFTACETLRRMGLPVADVRRATIWTFEVERDSAAALATTIATLETIYNPNKHTLTERAHARPHPGEVWIEAGGETSSTSLGGRRIAGVSRIERRTAWQLLDETGAIVDSAVLDRAIETFLCNPAFQKAIR